MAPVTEKTLGGSALPLRQRETPATPVTPRSAKPAPNDARLSSQPNRLAGDVARRGSTDSSHQLRDWLSRAAHPDRNDEDAKRLASDEGLELLGSWAASRGIPTPNNLAERILDAEPLDTQEAFERLNGPFGQWVGDQYTEMVQSHGEDQGRSHFLKTLQGALLCIGKLTTPEQAATVLAEQQKKQADEPAAAVAEAPPMPGLKPVVVKPESPLGPNLRAWFNEHWPNGEPRPADLKPQLIKRFADRGELLAPQDADLLIENFEKSRVQLPPLKPTQYVGIRPQSPPPSASTESLKPAPRQAKDLDEKTRDWIRENASAARYSGQPGQFAQDLGRVFKLYNPGYDAPDFNLACEFRAAMMPAGPSPSALANQSPHVPHAPEASSASPPKASAVTSPELASTVKPKDFMKAINERVVKAYKAYNSLVQRKDKRTPPAALESLLKTRSYEKALQEALSEAKIALDRLERRTGLNKSKHAQHGVYAALAEARTALEERLASERAKRKG